MSEVWLNTILLYSDIIWEGGLGLQTMPGDDVPAGDISYHTNKTVANIK